MPKQIGKLKRYLGDAVYADHDGYAVVLTTEDGYSVTNRIVLEPAVLAALLDWLKWLEGPPE